MPDPFIQNIAITINQCMSLPHFLMAPFHLFPTRSTEATLHHGWMYSGRGGEGRRGEGRGEASTLKYQHFVFLSAVFSYSCPEGTVDNKCRVSCANYECKNNGTCFIANGAQHCRYVKFYFLCNENRFFRTYTILSGAKSNLCFVI